MLRIERIDLLCDSIIEPRPKLQEHINDIEKQILSHETPNNWNTHNEDNMEKVLEVDFFKNAALVKSETGIDLNETTTFAYYATVEMIEEKYRKK